ncbi:hypothetical protein OG474_36955 [Kribbella sp. NBC_01505]|uniref:hypothetical protein n=1 Tax=Kribbella sp. NBC_01505 TaxID=2903580 RepID=UPI00386BD6EC
MTYDLADKFATLTDDRPEPADPAVLVRSGITRSRRRRRTGISLAGAAVVTAIALTAAPLAGALRGGAPEVAGAPTGHGTQTVDSVRWAPQPNRTENLYQVASRTIDGEIWEAFIHGRDACLSLFHKAVTDPMVDPMKPCVPHQTGVARPFRSAHGGFTVFAGSTSTKAAVVRITSGDRVYLVKPVPTIASKTTLFYAFGLPGVDFGKPKFQAYDAKGKPVS